MSNSKKNHSCALLSRVKTPKFRDKLQNNYVNEVIDNHSFGPLILRGVSSLNHLQASIHSYVASATVKSTIDIRQYRLVRLCDLHAVSFSQYKAANVIDRKTTLPLFCSHLRVPCAFS